MKHLFKTRMVVRLCAVAIIAFSVLSGCKSYDKDIDALNANVATLTKQLSDLKTSVGTVSDATITDLKTQIKTLQDKLAALPAGVTKAELDALKADLTSKLVALEAFNAFKTAAEKDIADLKAKLDKKAGADDLATLKTDLNKLIVANTTSINELGGKINTLDGKLVALTDALTADKAALATYKGTTDARLATIEALLKIKDGKSEYDFSTLKDQLAKITANANAITKLQEDLKLLQAQINGGTVTPGGEPTAGVDAQMKKLQKDLGIMFTFLSRRLTSVVFVPTSENGFAGMYVDGVEAINVAPLSYKCQPTDSQWIQIVPAVKVKYRLSPSTLKKEDIDINNLTFTIEKSQNVANMHTAPAATTAPVKATFVDLLPGAELVVSVKVEDYKQMLGEEGGNGYFNDNQGGPNDVKAKSFVWGEKFHVIALNVPMSDKALKDADIDPAYKAELGTVSSQFARLFETPINNVRLVRNKAGEDGTTVLFYPYVLPRTEGEAKELKPYDPTVIYMAYSETINLKDSILAMMDWVNKIDLEKYDLEFVFDKKIADGTKDIVYELGANKTDQQKFVDVTPAGMATTRVYTIDGQNPASVDRTPIVRVILRPKNTTCIPWMAFIKIVIVKDKPVTYPPYTETTTWEAKCGDNVIAIIDTKEMNEKIYFVAKSSKENFHINYTLEKVSGTGTLTEKVDPLDTQSYNVLWTLTEAEAWANIGKTVTIEGRYISKDGSQILPIKFTATITKESINLSSLMITNYWYANKTYVIHNSAVPADRSVDPATCTYDNDINNAFKTNDAKALDLASIKAAYAQYTYAYTFVPLKEQTLYNKEFKDGADVYKISNVSADGKTLYATKNGAGEQPVAVINPYAAATGDVLSYQNNDIAKFLLNVTEESMIAKLKLTITNTCGKDVTVNVGNGTNVFDVHFLRPVNLKGVSTKSFVDGVDFGAAGSWMDIKSVAELSDWRNYIKKVSDYNFDPNHVNYYKYYDVTAIAVDATKITPVDLKDSNGNAITKLPSTVVITQTAPENPDFPYGKLTYKNNGNNLGVDFKLSVPVTVTYKWGVVKTYVLVPVKATATPTAPVKRK